MGVILSRREAPAIAPALAGLPPVMQRIYAARGVVSPDELCDELSGLLSPDSLLGITAALDRLATALQQREHIMIVGDFDADGATSTALSVRILRQMGACKVSYLVPNRFTSGYGLTPALVKIAVLQKPDLIITVDNGIASIDGVAAARAAGIDVIVTDHHLPGDKLPQAVAIVNPNQPGDTFPSKCMAGVGVVFYLFIALRRYLQDVGWFVAQGLSVPNLAQHLDLLALGTVADVVTLDHNNRIMVAQGLKRMRAGKACFGIQALLQVAKREPRELVAQDLGFAVGPRLNAAGRLEDMSIGIACLLADTMEEALAKAKMLDELNRSRRDIESDMTSAAFAAVDQVNLSGDLALGVCVHEPDWHQGVVGLVASRVKERVQRPVIAFAKDCDTYLKGSARSVPGVHIRDVLATVAARDPKLIEQFGGHAMAAGLKIRSDLYADFAKSFAAVVAESLSEDDCREVIWSDGELAESELTLPFAEQIRSAVPWGQGFPEPVFDGEFELLSQREVGEGHLKLELSCAANGHPINAIWFRADMEKWRDALPQRVHVAYRLDINSYRDRRSLQLVVLSMAVVT